MGNITDERTSQSDVEQVKDRVQEVAEQAKGQTRQQLRSQIDTRSTEAGEQLVMSASAFRRTAEQLRQEGNERAASMVEAVADRGDRFGAYLTRADGDAILGDVEDFARRQPWLMVGAGAVVGFAAARFLKASSGIRYRNTAQSPRVYGGSQSYRPATSQPYTDGSRAVPTAGGSSGIG